MDNGKQIINYSLIKISTPKKQKVIKKCCVQETCCVSPFTCHMSLTPTATDTDPIPANSSPCTAGWYAMTQKSAEWFKTISETSFQILRPCFFFCCCTWSFCDWLFWSKNFVDHKKWYDIQHFSMDIATQRLNQRIQWKFTGTSPNWRDKSCAWAATTLLPFSISSPI